MQLRGKCVRLDSYRRRQWKNQSFPKNCYFSLVAGKIIYLFKATTGSIYIIRVYHMASHNWFLIRQGNRSRGKGMRSGFRRNEVHDSPRVN